MNSFNRLGIMWVPMIGVHITDDFGNLVEVPVSMFSVIDNLITTVEH